MAVIVKREVGDTSYEEVNQQNPFPVEVVQGERTPATPAQFGLSFTSSLAVRLNPPPLATCGEIYVRTASIVFTRDGTAPTATRGIQADPSDIIPLYSKAELLGFRGIAVGATATADCEYFTALP